MTRLSNYTFVRPRTLPVLITLSACLLLFSLGAWQLQRLTWKEDLIEKLHASMEAAPRTLISVPEHELREAEFIKVRFEGRRQPKPVFRAAQYFRGKLGYHLLVPVMTSLDKPAVLVNLGWIPADQRGKISYGQAKANFVGMARPMGRKGWFTPANQPANNLWFWYDHAALEAFTGMTLLPVVVDRIASGQSQESNPTPPVGFDPAQLHLRNDHLYYAITWFALGFIAIGVFLAYHVRKKAA